LLTHLYVLIPVVDNEKHYWVAEDEIEKLLKRGEGWLPQHPERDLIVSRYLKRQRNLTREALSRLLADDTPSDETEGAPESEAVERIPSLHTQRLQTVFSVIKGTGAKRVLDLGCGEGKLLRLLLAEKQFESILGMDVSWRSLETAKERLRLDELPERQRGRIELIQGSLTYRDQRLNGFEAAAIVEVIEHLDAARLATFERIIFEFARPKHVVLTTPNAEYNAVFDTLPAGEFRHGDHRFEWNRSEFERWSNEVAERFGYEVRFEPVGPLDVERGAPTQMAVFAQKEVAA
jgi:3' terminal RNA ribose 2'-O-methyltransferase Hen1